MPHNKRYDVWYDMVHRCHNPANPRYADYGGRGITVCERWRLGWREFIEDMGDPPKGMSIEREDNNGNYEPGNCRWATRSEQQSNRRNNLNVTYLGRTQTVTAWAAELGMNVKTLRIRVKNGLSAELVLRRGKLPNGTLARKEPR